MVLRGREREEKEKKKEDEQKGPKKADDSQAQMLEEILGDLDAELRTKTKKEEKQLDEERRAQEEKKRKSEELPAQPAKNRRQVEEAQKNEKKKMEEDERRKKLEEAKQAELEKRRLEKEAKARRAQEKFKERSDQQKKEKEVKKERKEKSKEGQTQDFRVKEEFAQSWAALPDEQISLMPVKIKDSAGKMYYLQRDVIQGEAEEEMANLERKLTERSAHAFSFPQRDQQPKMKIFKKWRQIIENQVFRICSEFAQF